MTNAEIAEAVKDLLAASVATAGGTIQRAYVPRKDVKDLKGLLVTVVTPANEWALQTRGRAWQRDATVDVGVQRKVSGLEDTDDAEALTESLTAVLRDAGAAGSAGLVGLRLFPFNREHLDQYGVYTGVIQAVYREAGV